MNKTIYWLTNDLRLGDNLALESALQSAEELAFVFVLDPAYRIKSNFTHQLQGDRQQQFVIESLLDISQQLEDLGHTLVVLEGDSETELGEFIDNVNANEVISAQQFGVYEQNLHQRLQKRYPQIKFTQFWQSTLFTYEQIAPYTSKRQSFSKFRSQVEKNNLPVSPVRSIKLKELPKPLACNGSVDSRLKLQKRLNDLTVRLTKQTMPFFAGELAAQYHLSSYFNSGAAKRYKRTRNELDGWANSTKFSPYLSVGNLSPRQIWYAVEHGEALDGANESTYWIKFELLWREYFQWLSRRIDTRLYSFKGLSDTQPLTSYFPERFQKWCAGNTPYPLVNALMKQLNTTGYMSNRGRQIVASCLVHELNLDWRYGAAYFQQQLIDFDIASNWGNWQYIAGVGVDPRGGRHFNIEKQTTLYDPKGVFIKQWQGDLVTAPLDSTDAVDWPISEKVS